MLLRLSPRLPLACIPWFLLLISSLSLRGSQAAGPLLHDLAFDSYDEAHTIQVQEKVVTYQGQTYTDQVFQDELGREAFFRGWNVSGSVKLVESGFKPFRSEADAEAAFDDMRQRVGANVVRFTISWEGVHPDVDTINTLYLDQVIAQMRHAIDNRMHILLDYHTDLFSRHLFGPDSVHTGNGAPAWVTPPGDYPPEQCLVNGVLCIHWSFNNLFNEAIRLGYRNFFNNAPFATRLGVRYMQDEFLWQLEQTLDYLAQSLTPEEFVYVLGVEPYNEPVYGEGHHDTAAEFDNEKLWPFYQRVRAILDTTGWESKLVFAEPQVFWNLNVPGLATGGGHLETPPGPGFVFTAHFYDALRQGLPLGLPINTGTYFEPYDAIRDEARFLNLPVFVSEFGMFLDGDGHQDTVRAIKASYNALEGSDRLRPEPDRFLDLYAPPISATQWHWDIYHDQHAEYVNGNPERLVTEGDAWNDENFSAIDEQGALTSAPAVLERIYPQRVQGEVYSFFYHDLAQDNSGEQLSWAAIRPRYNEELFRDLTFALLVWRGRTSDFPTELFLPAAIAPETLVVITDGAIYNQNLVRNAPLTQALNEVALTSDPAQPAGPASRLLIWDDAEAGETADTLHYALILVAPGRLYSDAFLAQAQSDLTQRIITEQASPIYLLGPMAGPGYPAEFPLFPRHLFLPIGRR